MRRHLLVSNDYPPKVGGIQNYLWELWRRLPSGSSHVYCTPHAGSMVFDAGQHYPIERSPEPFLLPYPWMASRIRRIADEADAELILLDPALPLGHIGPALRRPYGLILHGAEVSVPARLWGSRALLRRTLSGASLIVSAGSYALEEAEECVGAPLPSIVVPPGVDTKRFFPATQDIRIDARSRFGLQAHHLVVSSVNRLVPRKGMDRLIRASARLRHELPELRVLIGGSGREASRLGRLVEATNAPVVMLGRIQDEDVVNVYQASDLMAMLCHDRWNGLEQEGFGISFLEAAACGIPQIAGQSGGAAEAVVDGETGLVLSQSATEEDLVNSLRSLATDRPLRLSLGSAARVRAVNHFEYDLLAQRLSEAIDQADLRRITTGEKR